MTSWRWIVSGMANPQKNVLAMTNGEAKGTCWGSSMSGRMRLPRTGSPSVYRGVAIRDSLLVAFV